MPLLAAFAQAAAAAAATPAAPAPMTHAFYRAVDDGRVAGHIQAEAAAPRDLLGICVVGAAGSAFAAGDAGGPVRRRRRDDRAGKAGLGCFAPPLDGAGTSAKGQRMTRFPADPLGLGPFASRTPV